MAAKSKNNDKTGAINNRSNDIIVKKINEDLYSIRIRNESINPLLLPQKIRNQKNSPQAPLPYDILDMKSKKTIQHIGLNITELAMVNPMPEGGFGVDHPAVKTKLPRKKKAKQRTPDETAETVDNYKAMLMDLSVIMNKLAENREVIFTKTFSKIN